MRVSVASTIHSEVNPIGQCRETSQVISKEASHSVILHIERGEPAQPGCTERLWGGQLWGSAGFSSQDWGYFSTRKDGQLPRRSSCFQAASETNARSISRGGPRRRGARWSRLHAGLDAFKEVICMRNLTGCSSSTLGLRNDGGVWKEGTVAPRGSAISLREPADFRRCIWGVGRRQQRKPLLQYVRRLQFG